MPTGYKVVTIVPSHTTGEETVPETLLGDEVVYTNQSTAEYVYQGQKALFSKVVEAVPNFKHKPTPSSPRTTLTNVEYIDMGVYGCRVGRMLHTLDTSLIEDKMRTMALTKLTPEERRILGLGEGADGPRLIIDHETKKKLVDAFLAWPLPVTVCSDRCVTTRNFPNRSGTNMLTAVEAYEMFDHVLGVVAVNQSSPEH